MAAIFLLAKSPTQFTDIAILFGAPSVVKQLYGELWSIFRSGSNQNALRKHLSHRDAEPESCEVFDLVAHRPIFSEISIILSILEQYLLRLCFI